MSQPASAAPSRKKTVISLLVLAALTGIIVLLFKDNWAEITAALSQLSAWQVLVVLAIGLSYPLLEGCVAWVIVRSRIPGFRLWQGIDTAWCGTCLLYTSAVVFSHIVDLSPKRREYTFDILLDAALGVNPRKMLNLSLIHI